MKKIIFAITLFLPGLGLLSQPYSPAGDRIRTEWAEEINPENVWQEYPRPQFQRDRWMNLNGLWEYALLRKSSPQPKKYQGNILVPFCIESSLSGVGKSMLPEDRLWYRRTFSVPSGWKEMKVILHFEAVDWSAVVWVNGSHVGAHKGAYDRFSFDITPFLKERGTQEIVVAVDDPSSTGEQARGKQQMPQQGIWYTPVSGIWQTVWMEAVDREASLAEARIIPCVDREKVTVIPVLLDPIKDGYSVEVSVFDGNAKVAGATVPANHEAEIELSDPRLWSPGDPFLYGVKLVLKNPAGEILDEVDSYFGMRKISVEAKEGIMVLHLNNEPLFHYGPLDQGWWPDGLHTPPSDAAMRYDIEMTKAMGFNMIRKHIKVEPDRWYHHCDRLGIMVWQDMPSGMVVLPGENEERPLYPQHVGGDEADQHRRSLPAAQFEWELRRMIDLHVNAPSIVVWVPFNEGWGQYATCRIADMVKSLDPSRLVNAVSGWALRPCGDIYDIHTYQVEVHTPPISREMATVIGEYGGIGYPVKGHQWDTGMRNWGYQTYHSEEELLEHYKYKFDQIVEMKKTKGQSAAVYTQTTDVEGEVNGLMTYDRKVIKMPTETLKQMHSVLFE
ncbi:MAG TPA: glycoside hydrolase family 2 [Bacteroides sp.]|nr:glycoside hydrolase family 2 [Bacteroides sp.]